MTLLHGRVLKAGVQLHPAALDVLRLPRPGFLDGEVALVADLRLRVHLAIVPARVFERNRLDLRSFKEKIQNRI